MQLFVARQPIFDRKLAVLGYELLFRTGWEERLAGTHGDRASAEVISNAFLGLGLDRLTDGKKAFINFTPDLLTQQIPSLFRSDFLAIEILETVKPTEEILAVCRRSKEDGYLIVLDDYIPGSPWEAHLDLADIIKVDFAATDILQRRELLETSSRSGVGLLAEKVETAQQYEEALNAGFSYFQGYFFCRPEILSAKGIPGFKLNYLRLMQESHRGDFDFGRLEEIIKHDISLSYRLMRFINSATFGWQKKVESVRHALVLLGQKEVRRWVTLVSLAGMLTERPEELLVNSVIRARFCELLGAELNPPRNGLDLYLLGMFSSLDAILGRPMAELASEIPISNKVRAALVGDAGVERNALDLVLAYERGDWDRVSTCACQLKVDESELPDLYQDAIVWTSQAFFH